ncbi:DUF2294 domain-containing protein [Neobacillus terrae]|uniref:DUF2294 domain-containing protein n=1 Tax=Neobacillus terrae TaxID=3034837 RepID=UPI00140AC60D|nr:DUF2294 domain-containing protein [Neobacillus terrae]NHM33269.1 DUF2294 domain-containing protein [Neobacillus terrae]
MTKNSLEHQFSMLVREIRKEYVGNGPKEISTKFVGTWAISEMKGNLTNVEKFMLNTSNGKQMVHETRTKLVKQIYKKPEVLLKFEKLMGARVLRLFSDIDLDEDTAMTIFVFDQPIEGSTKG